jgi:hypothetical protein
MEEVLFPALVTKPDKFNYKSHNFAVEAETDPNQSWYELLKKMKKIFLI